MGNKLFGVDISGIINKNVGPGVLAATLIKITPGTKTTGSLTSGNNPVSTPYPCRGFIDRKARRNRDGQLVSDGTVTVALVGDSISGGSVAPAVNDKVTIEGDTYVIEVLDRDPAKALYTLSCRKI